MMLRFYTIIIVLCQTNSAQCATEDTAGQILGNVDFDVLDDVSSLAFRLITSNQGMIRYSIDHPGY